MKKAPSLKESSKTNALNEKSSNTILTVRKNQLFPKKTLEVLLKVLSTSTWSSNGLTIILKDYSFVQTINSRVNGVTKLTPNKVTRKNVLALVALIANSSSKLVQKLKFYVRDYVRIAKTDLPFRKGYKQIFTDEFFEIVAIPTVHPLIYSLIDAEKDEISGKVYEKELSLIGNKADYKENGH